MERVANDDKDAQTENAIVEPQYGWTHAEHPTQAGKDADRYTRNVETHGRQGECKLCGGTHADDILPDCPHETGTHVESLKVDRDSKTAHVSESGHPITTLRADTLNALANKIERYMADHRDQA